MSRFHRDNPVENRSNSTHYLDVRKDHEWLLSEWTWAPLLPQRNMMIVPICNQDRRLLYQRGPTVGKGMLLTVGGLRGPRGRVILRASIARRGPANGGCKNVAAGALNDQFYALLAVLICTPDT